MRTVILFAFIFITIQLSAQNTWYVRPAFSGQTYGLEDGTSYNDAWNGLETLNEKFQDGTIGATDQIYICGRHVFHDTTFNNPIALQGKIGIKSGQSPAARLVVRGDYPGDEGVIWGHERMDFEQWVDRGNNVWSIYLHAYYRWNWYFQDIESTEPDNPIILNAVNSMTELINTPGSTYSPSYAYDSLYVHLTDGGNPTHRIYSPSFGYTFDFDNYINTFSPLHNIVFKNLQMYGMGVTSNLPYTHIKWEGCIWAWSPGRAVSFWKGQDNNEIVNCDIGWCSDGVYGIDNTNDGGAKHILIKGNHFHDLGDRPEHQNSDEHAVGMQGGTDWIIENNYIERCGSGPLIYAYTNQRLTNTIIRYNFIKDCDPDGSATGYGIATQCNNNSFSDKSGNQVYYNIVVNCKAGIRLQFEDMQDCYNNTIYNCENSFVSGRNYDRKGARVDFKNNISVNPANKHILWYSGADTISFLSDYNLFNPDGTKFYWVYVPDFINERTFAQWKVLVMDSCTFDPNSSIGSPLFENGTGTFSEPEDFRLTANSPAINVGINVGLSADYAGNAIVGSPDIGAYEYQNPLAVEYLSPLQAFQKEDRVILKWATATEVNNDYFIVQCLSDENLWVNIGKVGSKGNASGIYRLVDTNPGIGTRYYRLKQYDYDDSFSYSNIASVYIESIDMQISPNPSIGIVHIVLPKNTTGEVMLYNANGKQVLQKTRIRKQETNIDLSHLPNGVYLITFISNGEIMNKKVVLER